jgi:hypothetical protein
MSLYILASRDVALRIADSIPLPGPGTVGRALVAVAEIVIADLRVAVWIAKAVAEPSVVTLTNQFYVAVTTVSFAAVHIQAAIITVGVTDMIVQAETVNESTLSARIELIKCNIVRQGGQWRAIWIPPSHRR